MRDRCCGISNGSPQSRLEEFILPIRLLPECLSASPATAIIAALEGPLPPQSIRIDAVGLEGRSDPIEGSVSCRRGVL